jgi:hypothetical protein
MTFVCTRHCEEPQATWQTSLQYFPNLMAVVKITLTLPNL